MEVVVSAPLCPLYAAASAGAERSDELLCGWTAELLEEFSTGWCRVRTKYRYEGWARREHLRPAGDWTGRNKRPVRAPFADVLARPAVESPVLDTPPPGGLAAPAGAAGGGPGTRAWLTLVGTQRRQARTAERTRAHSAAQRAEGAAARSGPKAAME